MLLFFLYTAHQSIEAKWSDNIDNVKLNKTFFLSNFVNAMDLTKFTNLLEQVYQILSKYCENVLHIETIK